MAIVPFPISGSNRLAGAAIIVERFPVPYVGPALRAWPQPNLVPVIPSTSRSTHSSGVSPSTSTSWGVPLIFNVKAMHAPLWLGLIGRINGRVSLTDERG